MELKRLGWVARGVGPDVGGDAACPQITLANLVLSFTTLVEVHFDGGQCWSVCIGLNCASHDAFPSLTAA